MGGSKTRVAVLGGGMGALSAAYELTRPERGGRYEVTVYTLGWRLGGKGASSRNPEANHRIEEHGLHLWMGCYENAFRIMRDCYRTLDRPAGAPLATLDEAFVARDTTVLMERRGGAWDAWRQRFPVLDSEPGTGDAVAGPLQMLWGLVRWGIDALPEGQGDLRCTPSKAALQTGLSAASQVRGPLARSVSPVLEALEGLWARHEAAVLPGLLATLRRALDALRWAARKWFASRLEASEPRRAFITLDYAISNAVGIIDDALALAPGGGLATYGQWLDNLARIDHLGYRAWLEQHGAHPATVDSCVVRGLGDAVFNSRHEGAAGAALNGLVRLNLTYRGSVFYQMQAGMGETVFTPLYEVLRARGVRFRFFHRVEGLRLDAARRRVRAVTLRRQVELRDEEYHPLVDVPQAGGIVRGWPTAPDWRQIEGGEALAAAGVDFEAAAAVPGETQVELQGFDHVVLGVPVGALPPLTRELAAARDGWRRMLDNVTCTPTQSVQLWFDVDAASLGWRHGVATATAYEDPLDTWAEMSHLLDAEGWAGHARQCSYLVGALDAPVGEPDPAEVAARAQPWIEAHLPGLLPRYDPSRVVAQYTRANTRPSDLYTLTRPGQTRHRLRPHRSGFDNLSLAGDWTKTGLNVGSIEAATMSGLRAAQAITGDDVQVIGDYEDVPSSAPPRESSR